MVHSDKLLRTKKWSTKKKYFLQKRNKSNMKYEKITKKKKTSFIWFNHGLRFTVFYNFNLVKEQNLKRFTVIKIYNKEIYINL